LDDDYNQEVLQKLLAAGVRPKESQSTLGADSPLKGKVFVFTGALAIDRRDAEERIKRLGARASGSVSKKTDYVVIGENAGSKADRARELGLTILSEEEFTALVEQSERGLITENSVKSIVRTVFSKTPNARRGLAGN